MAHIPSGYSPLSLLCLAASTTLLYTQDLLLCPISTTPGSVSASCAMPRGTAHTASNGLAMSGLTTSASGSTNSQVSHITDAAQSGRLAGFSTSKKRINAPKPTGTQELASRKKHAFQIKGTSMASASASSSSSSAPSSDDSKEPSPVVDRRVGVSRYTSASANPTRFWMGTYYPTDDESAQYLLDGSLPPLRLDYEREDVTCWRGQWEYGGKGDKDGKLHCQFAVAFRDQVRAPQARRIIGGQHGPHMGYLEPAFSKTVWDYVTKTDSRVQAIEGYGNLTDDSGNRSDLDIIYAEIAQGTPIYDIMSRFPRQFMRNHAAISKLCAMYDRPRPYGACTVEIWWGVTGSGKSHKAFHEYPHAYRKSIPGKWWEGYRGESVVVFEEFNPNEDKELRLPELLKILDKYPYQVEIKGASMQLKANHFIFTTNIDPRTWYDAHPQMPALCRRVSKVIRFTLSRDDQMEYEQSGQLEYAGMHQLEKDLLA